MTKYRIKWKAEGESLVTEAHGADDARELVAEAVGRAGGPFRVDGAAVEHERFAVTQESPTAEDG